MVINVFGWPLDAAASLNTVGLLIEAVGAGIFTWDAMRAVSAVVSELERARNEAGHTRRLLSVHLRTDSITVFDGPNGGVDLGRAQVFEAIDPKQLPAALTQRRWLRVGAVAFVAGIALQLVGNAMQALATSP